MEARAKRRSVAVGLGGTPTLKGRSRDGCFYDGRRLNRRKKEAERVVGWGTEGAKTRQPLFGTSVCPRTWHTFRLVLGFFLSVFSYMAGKKLFFHLVSGGIWQMTK